MLLPLLIEDLQVEVANNLLERRVIIDVGVGTGLKFVPLFALRFKRMRFEKSFSLEKFVARSPGFKRRKAKRNDIKRLWWPTAVSTVDGIWAVVLFRFVNETKRLRPVGGRRRLNEIC